MKSYTMTRNDKHEQMRAEAVESIIDALDEYGYSGYYCDLHNEVFNTDYYIIGTGLAKAALTEYDVWEALDLVQTYEREQFGEIYTDLSDPEKVINMVWYVIGDQIIGEMCEDIDLFNDKWNDKADKETNEAIVKAMRELGM